jgi:hypothetical protein
VARSEVRLRTSGLTAITPPISSASTLHRQALLGLAILLTYLGLLAGLGLLLASALYGYGGLR